MATIQHLNSNNILEEFRELTDRYQKLSTGYINCKDETFQAQLKRSLLRLARHYPSATWRSDSLFNTYPANFRYQLLQGGMTMLERMVVMDAVLVLMAHGC